MDRAILGVGENVFHDFQHFLLVRFVGDKDDPFPFAARHIVRENLFQRRRVIDGDVKLTNQFAALTIFILLRDRGRVVKCGNVRKRINDPFVDRIFD